MRTEAMQSRYTAHIMSAEWRWVTLASCILVLLAFAPLLWVALRGTPGWQFMGTLHNYQDGATYLSKMMLGESGAWLVTFQHTPELHNGAFIQVIYLALGHLARITGVPLLVMFHAARVIAALMMYAAIYQLAASIWVKVRPRKVFFTFASIGAGFGWFLGPLTGTTNFPDLTIPEAFPLYSSFMNVHFPLTIACLALLAGLFITLFRPSVSDDPSFDHGWWAASLLSLLLAFLYPQALIPLGGALIIFTLSLYIQRRRLEPRIITWLLAVILPVLPVAVYIFMIVGNNPALAEWNRQNVTDAPPLWSLLLGYGLPLIIAMPGILRALRRFEADGDRLMILWLICMVIAIYFPTNVQRRFAVGMMLPIAYFAARAMEDVWLPRISRRLRPYTFAILIPIMAISQGVVLFLPVMPALVGVPEASKGIFLQDDYAAAYHWLEPRTREDSVVLASPMASTWLPGWAGARVVYGHPYETLNADAKRQAVIDWYSEQDVANCAALLETYSVRYVLAGPEEALIGSGVCLEGLRVVTQIGAVTIYAP